MLLLQTIQVNPVSTLRRYFTSFCQKVEYVCLYDFLRFIAKRSGCRSVISVPTCLSQLAKIDRGATQVTRSVVQTEKSAPAKMHCSTNNYNSREKFSSRCNPSVKKCCLCDNNFKIQILDYALQRFDEKYQYSLIFLRKSDLRYTN